jgi:aflatoxin B1 aldehyde reductase
VLDLPSPARRQQFRPLPLPLPLLHHPLPHSLAITFTLTPTLPGPSEETLGAASAGTRYTLDTKWLGGWAPGWATKENIISSAQSSIRKLKVPKVDIFYLHAHDKDTPLTSTLAGVQEAYEQGLFTRFGLSNYLTETVQEVYDICKKEGYVLPSAYQVNYSAVTRKPEEELFPLLRKLGIAIYAYSPIAGGLLAKTRKQIEDGESRFDKNAKFTMYSEMYAKPSYLDMLDEWQSIAEEVGCSKADLAYRWVAFHSALDAKKGDAVIVGASRVEQLDQTLKGLEAGKLPREAARRIEGLWEGVKGEAPVDNFYR